jgi:hypothetical protein
MPYSLRTQGGDSLAGTALVAEPWGFLGTLDAWGEGLFRASVDTLGGRTLVHVGLATWTPPAERVAEWKSRTAAVLETLFA